MIGLASISVEWGIVVVIAAVAAAISARQIKHDGMPEVALTSSYQRVVCAVLLVAMCGSWAIYYAGWHLFGGYEKQVALLAQALMILYALRLSTMLRKR